MAVLARRVTMLKSLTVENWPLARLRAAVDNPRRHPAAQISKLQRSLRDFGFNNPILATPDGEIIAGEARLKAAQAEGLAEVPVIVIPDLLPSQIKAYRLADNRIALDAVWDDDLLKGVMFELKTGKFDLTLTGFENREVRKILHDVKLPVDPEATPVAPVRPVSKLGDLWVCGAHRVLCGDSTQAESYIALMDESKQSSAVLVDAISNADLVFTDPPYGMSYNSKKHGMIINDDARGSALVALVRDAITQARAASKPEAATYVCLTWRTYADFLMALHDAGLDIAACIVWDKGSVGLGSQHYRPQHEFIFYCKGANWYGGKGEGDVWRLNRDSTADYAHPTQKPVALIEHALLNSTCRGDVVLDPFGGSGSTLIASEQQGRCARLIELDPKYVDVIVRRWEKISGQQAFHMDLAMTFAEVAAHRNT